MPTRLLDWTENAAAALYFAVEYPNEGEDSALWCSGRPPEADSTKDPFAIQGICFYEPPHIAPRITAQSACFTAHPTDYIGKYYKWPCELVMLVIDSKARAQIRATLRAHGVHRASLFPEPAGIAEEIRRCNSSMEDEKEFHIRSAFYGTGDSVIDVTDVLRVKVADNQLNVVANNDLAGDPCPGKPKILTINFMHQGKSRKKTSREGERAILPE